ncbi:MliC family protein [Luteimonas panaciterrae]|uniref:MliC family protein n=1 Tax=Luteimonas panaciterrae TaxID=363885 RepID=UPI001CFC3279|nr:MliC family protein [Luteimonas panaciterrae]
MRQGITVTTGLMLAAMMVACSPSKPPEKSEAAQPAEDASASLPAAEPAAPAPVAPVPAAPASDAPPGSMVVYACDDGSGLTVTYDKSGALVKLPSGSTMLPRAESASGGGGDAYLGEELSLYRNGNLVQLQVAGKSHTCTQSPTSG